MPRQRYIYPKKLSEPWTVTRQRVWLIPNVEAPAPNITSLEQTVIVDTE